MIEVSTGKDCEEEKERDSAAAKLHSMRKLRGQHDLGLLLQGYPPIREFARDCPILQAWHFVRPDFPYFALTSAEPLGVRLAAVLRQLPLAGILGVCVYGSLYCVWQSSKHTGGMLDTLFRDPWLLFVFLCALPALLLVLNAMFPSRLFNSFTPSKHGDNTLYPYGVAETIGRRPYMEDRFLAAGRLNDDRNCCLFGVFDGHGGSKAAEYCVGNLIHNLVNDSYFTSNPARALTNAFVNTDKGFLEVARYHHPPLDDGTTAIVTLVVGDQVWAANAGDSRAVIVQQQAHVVPLSDDHKPNRPDETNRIRQAGGNVYFHGVWRVGGILAVSRAIGDRMLKNQGVTAEPEIRQWRITPADLFLVLASDGLWDVLSNQEVAQYVCSVGEPEAAAKRLIKEALGRGSADNITCLIVDLQHPKSKELPPESGPTPQKLE